jgi:hypothetical protein
MSYKIDSAPRQSIQHPGLREKLQALAFFCGAVLAAFAWAALLLALPLYVVYRMIDALA